MSDGLSPREWTVLFVVAQTPRSSVADLDQHELVAPGSARPHLLHLRQLGLITTTPEHPRRYSPTAAGLATVHCALAACP